MNKRQVLILWLVAVVLGAAIAFVKFGQRKENANHTARAAGATVLEKFPAAEVAAIEITGAAGNAVSLAKKDGKWTLAQRDGYPASAATVNGFLRTVEELKVTQGIQAGPSFAARFGLDESATTPEKRGLTVAFKDAAGKELAKLSIDQRKEADNPASPMGGGAPSGRFVRNHADDTGVYRVSESFSTLTDDVKRWLATDFIQVEKLKTVAVSEPDKDAVAWSLKRDTEEGAFALDGAAAGEALDTAVTDPLKSLFSYSRVEDVITKDRLADRLEAAGKRTVTLTTFDGFTYTLTLVPLKPQSPPPAPDPENPAPPPADNYAVTVEVKAELAKERTKAADEKPEDAKSKDEAFAARLKTLNEKLAKEQALAGHTFEIAKYTIENLLKERSALLKKEETPATPGNPPVPAAPSGPIEAVTPPIAVPPAPVETPQAPAEAPPAPAETPEAPAETPEAPAEAPPAPAETPQAPAEAPAQAPAEAPAQGQPAPPAGGEAPAGGQ